MPARRDSDSPPDEDTLLRIATAINPGARVDSCSQLAGGISNATFRLEIRNSDDSTESVVL